MVATTAYSQTENDSIPNIIKIWNIEPETYSVDSILFDTSTMGLLDYNPIYDDDIIPTHLGNEGLPFRSNIISQPKYSFPFFSFENYLLSSRNIK